MRPHLLLARYAADLPATVFTTWEQGIIFALGNQDEAVRWLENAVKKYEETLLTQQSAYAKKG